jgi:hypothetical protein
MHFAGSSRHPRGRVSCRQASDISSSRPERVCGHENLRLLANLSCMALPHLVPLIACDTVISDDPHAKSSKGPAEPAGTH